MKFGIGLYFDNIIYFKFKLSIGVEFNRHHFVYTPRQI